MTAPNFETNDETETTNPEGADPIDSSPEGANIQPQNTPPQPPAIDFAALYRESVAERRRLEEERERLLAERNAPQHQDPEITDEYFEKHGTAKGVKTIVESTVSKLLRETLGDVGEISQDFKRNKQIASAEEKFYQDFPNLFVVRGQLSSTVRQLLSNAPNVDSGTYRQVALATIGALTAQGFNPNSNTPAAQPQTPSTPSVPSAPSPRSVPPTRKTVRKLTEFERSAMKRAGFDPNKSDDIDGFFAMVENDEGVTV